jgi:hypothetical protein
MKGRLITLIACLGLMIGISGCAEDLAYADPPVVTSSCVDFTDDWGVREVCGPHYFVDGQVIYWDAHFGYWIAPWGYWVGNAWHRGWMEGYHTWYHTGHYRSFTGHPGGWRAGSGWSGHGGHNFGGHGGGHR